MQAPWTGVTQRLNWTDGYLELRRGKRVACNPSEFPLRFTPGQAHEGPATDQSMEDRSRLATEFLTRSKTAAKLLSSASD
jgi:hypothetical protein